MPTIGVQMMMLKNHVEDVGPHEVLRRLSESGFSAVEVSQIAMTPENVAEMVRARDELGIDFGALSAGMGGGPNESLLDDFDKIVADTKALGASRLRIGMMPYPAMASHEALLEFCGRAEKVSARLADEGITLYYHNHHVEFARRGGSTLLDVIRAEAPTMRLEIDVHWVQRGGRDPVRTLQQYAGLVDLVHLKDYRIGELDPSAFDALADGDRAGFMRSFTDVVQFAEVGEGNLDWAEIIDQSLDSGAEYLFIEQDQQYGRDPYDCLRTSRENLVALGYGHLI
ncbi:Sugar phosphate isomerase/epimerase [Pseudonocardia sp. Ae168_Ps1]|uniref:sugar phosphate isomerase/epimerase family protein n=1 Tax=unclassified Pseudonocardia TaxID=2619320 RepID=UPI0001FFDC3D|nr:MULTISPECIES: sugar phosphate isomerase/epimerase [unclassified Pseudonocardia]OLL72020.1 Sugar phosphate isomerase/epimerase [Pseudonocardia sp. Ae150A_Ps1]OLL77986.1 Sugar phosphate isomerase/epimerase [Pseudonocardia sp. Ae168_Ps1]OLL92085.1 Sugar phosphate isomerase/epimerase [Pseudonocardia sp. Ae356_Ps1]OLM18628.1 Sugar phosphate isomerase/epimerase [Pseudonocardia sp. Ae707_Ps1]